MKAGFQYQTGTFYHDVDLNGDLLQVYRSSATGIPFSRPDTVIVRNTPLLHYGERMNYDMGLFVQDTWTLKRLTLNAGIRYEWLNASVIATEQPAGRFVPARSFPEVKNVPNWKDSAPRFALVYDLFGNSKTALKYSLNRYNQARTTGIASLYSPAQSQTFSLAWTDINADNIAQGDLTFNPDGTRQTPCVYLTARCEINFTTLPANFGIASPNEFGDYPRTWNVEQGIEIQHELLPRIDRQLVPRVVSQPDADDQPQLAVRRGRSDAEPELHADDGLQPPDWGADHHLCADRDRPGAADPESRYAGSGSHAQVRRLQHGVPGASGTGLADLRRLRLRASARDQLRRGGQPEHPPLLRR